MNTMVSALLVVFTSISCASLVLCQGVGGARADALRDVDKRLVGVEAPVGRFPYICSLRRRGGRKHACGATLVNPLWVVTAAHCVDPNEIEGVGLVPIVYCGIHDVDERNPDLIFNAITTVLHPSWSGVTSNGYDIAMIQLDRSATLITPALNVPGNVPQLDERRSALGWGKTPTDPNPDKLQMTNSLEFIAYRTCNPLWGGIIPVDIVLCAGIGERDTCRGDSGGPLLKIDAPDGEVGDGEARLDLLLGIISFGADSCGDGTRPGVYTDVGYFRDWIQGIIEGRSPPPESTPPPPPPLCPTSPVLKDVIAAIKDDDSAEVRAVLDCGLDPDSRYNDTTTTETETADDTLLHWAIRFDASDSAKVLIDSGAEVESRNSFGSTPLHYCGIFGSVSVAKVLIDKGADVNANGLNGYRPLHYAARDGQTKVAELLLESGADVDAQSDSHGTPLNLAAWNGRVDAAKSLLSAGADVSAEEEDGDTPLHNAAYYDHVDIVKLLLNAGAEIDAAGADDVTPLHYAAQQSSLTVLEVLLAEGADVNAKANNGHTPLHEAAVAGHADISKILINAGADLDAADDIGETPLHEAAEYGHLDVVMVLVEAGASKTIRDNKGNRPEDIICDRADPDCTRATLTAIEDLVAP